MQGDQDHNLLQIGFDRHQRYRATAEIIAELAGGRSLRILDLGGLDRSFGQFLRGHHLTDYEGMVTPQYPIALPDGAADIVCALDVLEHVPPEQRGFFVGEALRVASLAAILAFPIKQAEEAEKFVLSLTHSPWLAEHRQHGLPDPAWFEAMLSDMGVAFTRRPNACLPSWTAMMLLMYGTQEPERGRISTFFNRSYYKLENREPAYRYIYICRKKA